MLLNKMYAGPLWESSHANLAHLCVCRGVGLCGVCRMESAYLFVCALYVCFSPAAALRGNGCRKSCASWWKHIGQLRWRLCVALLCVELIESERQPLTALLLRTLLVITHKSLFPCIGSSAQLRPHKQLASGLIYYLRLLIDLFRCTVRHVIHIYYTVQRVLHLKLIRQDFLQVSAKKGKNGSVSFSRCPFFCLQMSTVDLNNGHRVSGLSLSEQSTTWCFIP